jgi:hypothetical protein
MTQHDNPDHSGSVRTCPRTALFPIQSAEAGSSDKRFTFGLVLDVLAVLANHGYPDARQSSADFIEMRQALYGFLCCAPVTADGDQR